MTTTHDSLASLQRHITDAIDRQDWAAVKELTAPRARIRTAGQDMDFDGWLAQGKAFYSAFPDGKHEIQDVVVETDRVAMRGVWRGTHQGPFNGIAATGRRVAVDMVMVDRFVEGQLVERIGVFDALALLQQIGALPSA
jgi:predicted ester cyclase